MLKTLKQLWRPTEYHVEYFRGSFGMDSYHDDKRFNKIDEAESRMEELKQMSEDEITAELGFTPTFLRILQVTSGHPLTRILNATGRKSMWRLNLYFCKIWI